MPSDTTKPKRTQKNRSKAELMEIEQKRLRGEISCAECRRLKLRCDKKVPCGSCIRRGCDSICPSGILSAGQGTRFILADTEKLHVKICDMSQRIRQLEDGLAIMQASVSSERHPLLSDDLLKIKFGPEAASSTGLASEDIEKITTQATIEAFGTLTLDSDGAMKYFGRSAGTQALMEWDEEDSDDEIPPQVPFVSDILSSPHHLPANYELALQTLENSLPSRERALVLCNSYVDIAAHFFRPIKQDELVKELLPHAYGTAADRSAGLNTFKPSEKYPHDLALLFAIFALGALYDLSLPPSSPEAEHYFEMSRQALHLKPFMDAAPINAVRALGLLSTYCASVEKKYTRDIAWIGMSLTMKLAQGIGLHRDTSRWKLEPKAVDRNRSLWWEIFACDVSHSLAVGRPLSIDPAFIDCEYPIDEEATLNNAGEIQPGFWRLKYSFAREMFMPVLQTTLTAQPTPYSRILELDRRIVNQFRTITMQYLHRSFFAQAVLDSPANPLLSPFAPSYLTAYRCASIIIKAGAHLHERAPEMAQRVWFLIGQVFSSAVIVGTVVSRNPSSNLAPGALMDLTLAIKVFEQSAPHSNRARTALHILSRVRDHAIRSYSEYNSTMPGSIPTTLTTSEDKRNADHCLGLFGGQERVLRKKKPRVDSPSSLNAAQRDPTPPTQNLDGIGLGDGSTYNMNGLTESSVNPTMEQEVHFALMQFLATGASDFKGAMMSPPQLLSLQQDSFQFQSPSAEQGNTQSSTYPNLYNWELSDWAANASFDVSTSHLPSSVRSTLADSSDTSSNSSDGIHPRGAANNLGGQAEYSLLSMFLRGNSVAL